MYRKLVSLLAFCILSLFLNIKIMAAPQCPIACGIAATSIDCLTKGDGKSIQDQVGSAVKTFANAATSSSQSRSCKGLALTITAKFATEFLSCQALATKNGGDAKTCLDLTDTQYDQAINNALQRNCIVNKTDLRKFSIDIAGQLRKTELKNSCAYCKLGVTAAVTGRAISIYATAAYLGLKLNQQLLNAVIGRLVQGFINCEGGIPLPKIVSGIINRIVPTIPVPVAYFPLSVSTTGGGAVSDGGGKINCGSGGNSCEATFKENTTVNLSANPEPGYKFIGWTGDCSGTGACSLEMNNSKSVSAQFEAKPVFTLSINPSTGGTVTSVEGSINCGTNGTSCKADFAEGANVTLVAQADDGYKLAGWNVCSGTDSCTVKMDGNISVTPTFEKIVITYSGDLSMFGTESLQYNGATCTWSSTWALTVKINHKVDIDTWNAQITGTKNSYNGTSTNPLLLNCINGTFPVDLSFDLNVDNSGLSGTMNGGDFRFDLNATQTSSTVIQGALNATLITPGRSGSSFGQFQLKLEQ